MGLLNVAVILIKCGVNEADLADGRAVGQLMKMRVGGVRIKTKKRTRGKEVGGSDPLTFYLQKHSL